MEAIKEKLQTKSGIKQKRNKQGGKIGGMQAKVTQNCTQNRIQETQGKLNVSVKNMSHNCAICRKEYLLVDFKSSRICDECVQYIKENC